jgi:integrase
MATVKMLQDFFMPNVKTPLYRKDELITVTKSMAESFILQGIAVLAKREKRRRLLVDLTQHDVDEMEKMTPDLRDRLCIRILAYCALREAEMVGSDQRKKRLLKPLPGLRVEDIDFDRKRLTIYGKGWASGQVPPREVPIDSETLELIKKYMASRGIKKGKLLDLGPRQVQRIVKEAAVRADVPNARLVSPHRLRSFALTKFYQKTKNLPETQRIAGHRRSSTTTIYTRPPMSDVDSDYRKVFEGKRKGS